ncbi:MAG: methylenetetrahydrofolate reductase [NAD(P)H] [Clostridia bacterium]|nr:methylenetetrahydrofolate reductase [NAD(P)H] [Clostridia bacterium]
MKITELFKKKKPLVAFEIFPPKADVPLETIFDSLEKFKSLKPDYISVTYGAGGSQKGRTVEIASKIKNEFGIETMAHFTCVGHSKEEIDSLLDSLHSQKLNNILALRGDPPVNQPDFDFSKNVYRYANELISHIRSTQKDFCLAAAAYVEGHVDSLRLKQDMLNLKQKVDAGVDFLVTQLFFDNRLFYDFLDKAETLNINCPITPGIMPIFKADQIKAITARSGCSLPAKLVLLMDKYHDNPEDMRKAGVEYASVQIRDLIDNGVDGVHLYTMNRPKSTQEILENAGLL